MTSRFVKKFEFLSGKGKKNNNTIVSALILQCSCIVDISVMYSFKQVLTPTFFQSFHICFDHCIHSNFAGISTGTMRRSRSAGKRSAVFFTSLPRGACRIWGKSEGKAKLAVLRERHFCGMLLKKEVTE